MNTIELSAVELSDVMAAIDCRRADLSNHVVDPKCEPAMRRAYEAAAERLDALYSKLAAVRAWKVNGVTDGAV